MGEHERERVVWPSSPVDRPIGVAGHALATLDGARVGLLWNHLFRGDDVYAALTDALVHDHGVAAVVAWDRFGDFHNQGGDDVLTALPDRLRAEEVDAVIVGVGA
jgi:hypothetical protein